LATLYWAKNWLTRVLTVLFVGIVTFLWWFEDSVGLRYFVAFIGVMSALYSLWDILEDLILRKVNESDASKFSKVFLQTLNVRFVVGAVFHPSSGV
jgi:hypothetical protein